MDKYKLKIDNDNKLLEGREKFEDYKNKGKLEEWVNKYLDFLDENTKKSIIRCYNEIYNVKIDQP